MAKFDAESANYKIAETTPKSINAQRENEDKSRLINFNVSSLELNPIHPFLSDITPTLDNLDETAVISNSRNTSAQSAVNLIQNKTSQGESFEITESNNIKLKNLTERIPSTQENQTIITSDTIQTPTPNLMTMLTTIKSITLPSFSDTTSTVTTLASSSISIETTSTTSSTSTTQSTIAMTTTEIIRMTITSATNTTTAAAAADTTNTFVNTLKTTAVTDTTIILTTTKSTLEITPTATSAAIKLQY